MFRDTEKANQIVRVGQWVLSCNRFGTDHHIRACPEFKKCIDLSGDTKKGNRFVKTLECENENGREDELSVEEKSYSSQVLMKMETMKI